MLNSTVQSEHNTLSRLHLCRREKSIRLYETASILKHFAGAQPSASNSGVRIILCQVFACHGGRLCRVAHVCLNHDTVGSKRRFF